MLRLCDVQYIEVCMHTHVHIMLTCRMIIAKLSFPFVKQWETVMRTVSYFYRYEHGTLTLPAE